MKSKQTMVTTNIRLSKPDWLQSKTIAAQLGMSLNEYVTSVVAQANKNQAMVKSSTNNDVIWQLPDISPSPTNYQPKKLNKDDQLIYEE
jgi:hypothetical protein